jgi:hypothetical protein
MPDSEKEKFGIRIGWSNLYSGLHALQLGKKNLFFLVFLIIIKSIQVNLMIHLLIHILARK